MLLTVLLLDLFECLAHNGRPSTAEIESKHIDGALTLVGLRGSEQFNDPVNRRMFLHLGRTVLIRCLQCEIDVPPELLRLRSVAAQFVDHKDPKWCFSEAMFRYVRLRRAIRLGERADEEIVRIAMDLDGELINIFESVPADGFSQKGQSHAAYSDRCPKRNAHKTWSSLWVLRILVNEVIRERSQRLSVGEDCPSSNLIEQIAVSTTRILSLLIDIYQTVPTYTNTSIVTGQDREAAHTFVFPLYIIASSPICPEYMREGIIGRLGVIGSMLDIPQAIVAKEILEGRESGNPWGVVAMLRGLPFSESAWLGVPTWQ